MTNVTETNSNIQKQSMTREMLADRISREISHLPVFSGMSSSQISAILQFGARKEELEQMFTNV